MVLKLRIHTTVLVLLLVLPLPLWADVPRTFGVQLHVSSNDDLKGDVTSYISRELRSLSDVQIVDTNPEYRLSVIVMETRNKAGAKTGYAVSVVVTAPWNEDTLRSVIGTHGLQQTTVDTLTETFKNAQILMNHWIQVGDDLRKLCESVVAGFDGDTLESSRKFWRSLNKR